MVITVNVGHFCVCARCVPQLRKLCNQEAVSASRRKLSIDDVPFTYRCPCTRCAHGKLFSTEFQE